MCFFKIDKAYQEIFAILSRFLEDLLQSENLVRGAATRTKTAFGPKDVIATGRKF